MQPRGSLTHLRKKYLLNQLLPVSFASESPTLPPATIISSKRLLPSTVLLSTHLRSNTLSMLGQVLNSPADYALAYYSASGHCTIEGR